MSRSTHRPVIRPIFVRECPASPATWAPKLCPIMWMSAKFTWPWSRRYVSRVDNSAATRNPLPAACSYGHFAPVPQSTTMTLKSPYNHYSNCHFVNVLHFLQLRKQFLTPLWGPGQEEVDPQYPFLVV